MPKKSVVKKRKSTPNRRTKDNKLLVLLLILLAFILVLFYMGIDFKAAKHTTSKKETIAAVNSSTIIIPETSFAVTLIGGKGEFSDDVVEGTVNISVPYFSVKSESGYDTFAVMTYSTGGSGELTAVALFQIKGGKAMFRGSYPVGDGVKVENITKLSGDKINYSISVGYLDREEGVPMAEAPTVQKTLTFNVDNHRITIPAATE